MKRKHAKHIGTTGTVRKTVGRRVTTKRPQKATAVAWVGLGGRVRGSAGRQCQKGNPQCFLTNHMPKARKRTCRKGIPERGRVPVGVAVSFSPGNT